MGLLNGVAALVLACGAANAASTEGNACTCAGAVVSGTCYPTLADAIESATNGDTVLVGGKKVITKEIQFAKDLTIQGVKCKGKKATLSAKMNLKNNEYGMLRVRGPEDRTLAFDDLVFTREAGSGFAAGIRVGDLFSRERTTPYSLEEAPITTMSVTNCDFTGLYTYAMGGSSLYVHRAKNVLIDKSNTFKKNGNADSGKRFGGGGTVWITHIIKNGEAKIRGTFEDNYHEFNHGVSAGYFSDMVEGRLDIDATFRRNKASDGAAIHIFRPVFTAYVTIDGLYENNEAVELGTGSRGGAIRFQNVEAPVLIQGTYKGNSAQGRGGVIASNRFYKTGRMLIKGTFIDNSAGSSGGVFDQLAASDYDYIFEKGASLTLDGSCVFQGNTARSAKTSILNIGWINATLSEAQWVPGQTIVYRGDRVYMPNGKPPVVPTPTPLPTA